MSLAVTSHCPRLALGTAQFGMNYGISNESGIPSIDEVGKILALAHQAGIDTLDTAIAYGASEQNLGKLGVSGWKIVTKIPSQKSVETHDAGSIRRQVEASMKRLGVERLAAALLHDASELKSDVGLERYHELLALQEEKLIDKIGISIYSPEIVKEIPADVKLDLIQAPFNILDQRLVVTGTLDRLVEVGVEVHARSIFLQGLLLMSGAKRPLQFESWSDNFEKIDRFCEMKGSSRLQTCLGIALSQAGISRILVGVENVAQLKEILDVCNTSKEFVAPELASTKLDLIDPRRWSEQ